MRVGREKNSKIGLKAGKICGGLIVQETRGCTIFSVANGQSKEPLPKLFTTTSR